MRKPRRPFSAYKAAALAAYNRRNKVLKGLGYASYAEYLASPLWAEIRERKLASVDRRCFACGKSANQVHHGNYAELTLAGPACSECPCPKDDRFRSALCPRSTAAWDQWLENVELYAVCKKDHEWSEHFAGEKLPPEIATQRLKNRRRKNRLDEVPVSRPARLGPKERKAREMENELERLLERDEK